MVMRPLSNFGYNFACAASSKSISNAILNFDLNYGYRIVEDLMQEYLSNFNESRRFGSKILKKFLKTLCLTENVSEMARKKTCYGFKVISQKLCMPIAPEDSDYIFNKTFTHELLNIISNSITVRMYDSITWINDVKINEKSLYVKLALRYCPAVFGSVDKDF